MTPGHREINGKNRSRAASYDSCAIRPSLWDITSGAIINKIHAFSQVSTQRPGGYDDRLPYL